MKKTSHSFNNSNFYRFLSENKYPFLLILFIYSLVASVISLANYPYIDDIGRQLQGYTGFSAHYSRYLSELFAVSIQGSRHLTDTGLTSSIISASILSLASILVLYIFFGKTKIKWSAAISSVFIGLNPWFLEALSFRFDSPFLSLSILVVVLPFLFWKSPLLHFYLAGSFGVFLMCNSYQASSGIFILMTMTLVILNVTSHATLNMLWNRIFVSMAAFVTGLLVYFVQVKIFPPIFSESTDLGNVFDIPKNMLTNTVSYLGVIWKQSTNVWLVLFILIFILLGALFLTSSTKGKLPTSLYFVLYLILGGVLSYGVYMVFPIAYAEMRPRYSYGFGVFISFAMILLTQKETTLSWLKIKTPIAMLLSFYLLSFSFIFANSLKLENDYFISQSTILGSSLNEVLDNENRTVKMNRFVGDAPVFLNTIANYPILPALIISQANISWDYTMRFNSITNLQLNFEAYNPAEITFTNSELIEASLLFNIYKRENQIYVQLN